MALAYTALAHTTILQNDAHTVICTKETVRLEKLTLKNNASLIEA